MEDSDNQDSKAKVKVHIFSNRLTSTSAKSSTETSMEEIKTVVTWKLELEYQENSIEMTSFLQTSDCQNCKARLKVKILATEINVTSVMFPMETLVKEIRPVLTFEDDFDFGEESQ